MSQSEELSWKTVVAVIVLVLATSAAVVLAVTGREPRAAETPTTVTMPSDASGISAKCADAIAPARAFMAAHPAGSRLTSEEAAEIRGLAADAYNICPYQDMWALRQYELFPWAKSLASPKDDS